MLGAVVPSPCRAGDGGLRRAQGCEQPPCDEGAEALGQMVRLGDLEEPSHAVPCPRSHLYVVRWLHEAFNGL